MNLKDKLKKAMERQSAILAASKAAGNDSLTDTEQREFDSLQREIDSLNEQIKAEEDAAARSAAIEAERERALNITTLCREFNVDATPYIEDASATVDTVRAAILEDLKRTAIPAGSGVTRDEGDKFREAAADALCMRAGIRVSKPADGANEFRSYSLRSLAVESLAREGENYATLMRMDDADLLARFYNPTSAFPAILDNAIKKSIVTLYEEVPTTFEAWTSEGSLSDFKPSKDVEYVLGSFTEFKEVPENGELKQTEIKDDKLPTRELKTYGQSFSMTRQAFVNDDIGFITMIPGKFAASAKRTIDKQVYSLLINNGKIFDGKALFDPTHGNLLTTADKPSAETVQKGILKGQMQKDQFGQPIMWTPKFLICGVGYEFELAVLFKSAQVTGSSNNDINPLYNYPLQVVQTPVLNALAGNNECPWFLAANPLDCKGIQVDYLNGQKTPTVRRMEKAGTLGFTWDVWHDWGISVRDYRGIIKNPGEKIVVE